VSTVAASVPGPFFPPSRSAVVSPIFACSGPLRHTIFRPTPRRLSLFVCCVVPTPALAQPCTFLKPLVGQHNLKVTQLGTQEESILLERTEGALSFLLKIHRPPQQGWSVIPIPPSHLSPPPQAVIPSPIMRLGPGGRTLWSIVFPVAPPLPHKNIFCPCPVLIPVLSGLLLSSLKCSLVAHPKVPLHSGRTAESTGRTIFSVAPRHGALFVPF